MFPPRRRCFRRQTCKNTTSCLSQRPRGGVRLLGGAGGVSARLWILRCQLAFQKFLLTCRFYGMQKGRISAAYNSTLLFLKKPLWKIYHPPQSVGFYLDDISPGNIKNVSSIKSNDICFKCSFLFSFFFSMKNSTFNCLGEGMCHVCLWAIQRCEGGEEAEATDTRSWAEGRGIGPQHHRRHLHVNICIHYTTLSLP